MQPAEGIAVFSLLKAFMSHLLFSVIVITTLKFLVLFNWQFNINGEWEIQTEFHEVRMSLFLRNTFDRNKHLTKKTPSTSQ